METQVSSAQPGQYVQANGINIYYEQHGSGAPLLLIHSAMQNLHVWDMQVPNFAQHYTVIAPDTRGHGRTKNPHDTLNFRLLADDMAAFIQALGLDRPLVCGYSQGGYIALNLAIHYPHLAKAYVLGAISRQSTEAMRRFWEGLGVEGPGIVNIERMERDSPWAVPVMLESHDVFQGHDYWKTFIVQVSKLWTPPPNYSELDLKNISEPCLILMGDHDELMMVENAFELFRMIPHAEMAIVPGADHGLPGTKPDLYAQLILDFLLRQSVRSEER